MHFSTQVLIGVALVSSSLTEAIDLNVGSAASIKKAASIIAKDMMAYYTGNKAGGTAVGLLPSPYYWWEAGAMWGGMVEYWHLTGDTTYNSVVSEAILSQASATHDFMMMDTQAFDLGNDDQVFWALTAMSAAERDFPITKAGVSKTEWLDLAANTWNDLNARWNTTQCGGGLKWQFQPQNNGYDYKSSIANGGFFQLAARLARYTGNQTYVDSAIRTWDWMTTIKFLDSSNYNVYDGAGDLHECTEIDPSTWSYNAAMFLYGSAVLANISAPTTSSSSDTTKKATAADETTTWRNRTAGLMDAAQRNFFGPYSNSTGIMFERQCEPAGRCNTDQFSFKAYLARWISGTSVMVPELLPQIADLLVPTAMAVSTGACTGGEDGTTCGTKWYTGKFDGSVGLGQQLSALETVSGLLVGGVAPPRNAEDVTDRAPATAAAKKVVAGGVQKRWGGKSGVLPGRKARIGRFVGGVA